MRFAPLARRTLLVLAIAAAVAGCATPEESGPTDLDRDADNNGLPDDWERNNTNATEPSQNGSMPGIGLPEGGGY